MAMTKPSKRRRNNKSKRLKGVRVRCGIEGCTCKSFFKKDMYLLTAPVGSDAKLSAKTKFFLWRTNNKGILEPINRLDINHIHVNDSGVPRGPLEAQIFNISEKYAVYIIVHYDINYAIKCGDLINKGTINPEGSFGQPQILSLEDISTKNHKYYQLKIGGYEKGYITANKTANKFLKQEGMQVGHKNYNYQILFEKMPNSRCKWVEKSILKLQFHLGHMRYPIGGWLSPYHPTYPHRSVFDKKTYNGVLQFSKDATNRNGIKIKNHVPLLNELFDKDTLSYKGSKKDYDVRTKTDHITFQPDYTKLFTVVDEGKHPPKQEVNAFTNPHHRKRAIPLVYVDYNIGKAIEYWITNGYRKNGHILVSCTNRFPNIYSKDRMKIEVKDIKDKVTAHKLLWLRDDFARAIVNWNNDIKAMLNLNENSNDGLMGGGTYRDPYYLSLAKGVLQSSLHKTGLAIDLPQKNLAWPTDDFPVVFQREKSHYPKYKDTPRSRFRLFLERKHYIAEDNKSMKEIEENITDRLIKYRIEKCGAKKQGFRHANLYHYPSYKSRWGLISKSGESIEKSALKKIELLRKSVYQWKYLPHLKLKEYKLPDKFIVHEKKTSKNQFLDITSIAESYGIEGINAHKRNWYSMIRIINFNRAVNSFKNSSRALKRINDIPPGTNNQSIIREKGIEVLFENDNKLKVLELMDERGYDDTKHTGNSRCFFCKEQFSTKSVVRSVRFDVIAHESCFQHEKHKFLNNSFSKEIKLESVDKLQPDVLSEWGTYVYKWGKNHKPVFYKRNNNYPIILRPQLTLSFPELLSLNEHVFSKQKQLNEAHYLITFEKNGEETDSKILKGKDIVNYIATNCSWKICFRPVYSKKIEKEFKNGKCKKTLFNNLLSKDKKDYTLLEKWRKFLGKKFPKPDYSGLVSLNIKQTHTVIDNHGFPSLKQEDVLADFFKYAAKNTDVSQMAFVCHFVNENNDTTIPDKQYILLNKHQGAYKTVFDKFVRYSDGFKCHITPISGTKEKPLFIDKCKIHIPIKGIPRPLEWWHFQYDKIAYENGKRQSWLKLMEDIGWTKEALKYIGYSKKDFK